MPSGATATATLPTMPSSTEDPRELFLRWQQQDDQRARDGLVFSEADLLPGLIVDRYGSYLVVQTLSQGIYTQINVSGNAHLTLNSGVYIIQGGGLTVSGNASLTGNGVLIYNAGSNFPSAGGNFGGITLSGNGTVIAQLQAGVLAAVKRCTGTWCRIAGSGFDGWAVQEQLWGVYPNEKVE